MKKQLETRLNNLKTEFETGQTLLADLNKKRSDLEATLLRISGAIQVIEELLEERLEEQPEEQPKEQPKKQIKQAEAPEKLLTIAE